MYGMRRRRKVPWWPVLGACAFWVACSGLGVGLLLLVEDWQVEFEDRESVVRALGLIVCGIAFIAWRVLVVVIRSRADRERGSSSSHQQEV